MAAAYSQKETRALIKAWLEEPRYENIPKLCVRFNRTPKSIIAKLSKEGVYEKRGYLNKLGEKPRKKEDIVESISSLLGCELNSLEKADKRTLLRIEERISEIYSKIG